MGKLLDRLLEGARGRARPLVAKAKEAGVEALDDAVDEVVANFVGHAGEGVTSFVHEKRRHYLGWAALGVVVLAAVGIVTSVHEIAWVALGMAISLAVAWVVMGRLGTGAVDFLGQVGEHFTLRPD